LMRWRSPLDNISQHLDRINKGDRMFCHYGDLRDSQSIDAVVRTVKPDYVFHLAAQSYPKTSFDAPIDTYETNVQGTTRVLDLRQKRLFMSARHLRFLAVYQKKSYPLMKNAHFIRRARMQFQR